MPSKNDLKQLKLLASMLAPEYTKCTVHRSVTGQQLIDRKIHTVGEKGYKKPVKVSNKYVAPVAEQTPVNHFRAMKRLYNKYGIDAAMRYFKKKPKRQELTKSQNT